MNVIRQAWAEGGPSIGTVAPQGVTSVAAERLGRAGYDWVVLDLQHGGYHWDSVIPLSQAIELGGGRAVVRVPWLSPPEIMRALDYGAAGVIVPMISTAEDAAIAAKSTRYPPEGYRSNGRVRHADLTYKEANEDVVCAVMIETAGGWENLDSIAAVPGVDALIVGPSDLALALGWSLDNLGSSEGVDAVFRVVEAAERHGKAAGVFGLNSEHVRAVLQRGARFLTHSAGNPYASPVQAETIRDLKSSFLKTTGA
jgi:4-hydroxy-2-oxoheptanedioate aldolase